MEGRRDMFGTMLEGMSMKKLIPRIIIFLGLTCIIALREFVMFMNKVGRGEVLCSKLLFVFQVCGDNPIVNFFIALFKTFGEGLRKSLGSIWEIIINYSSYWNTGSWGSIVLGIGFMIIVFIWFYMIINQIVDMLVPDAVEDKKSSLIMLSKIGITIIVVLFLAGLTYYSDPTSPTLVYDDDSIVIDGGQTIDEIPENNTITEVVENAEIPTIDLGGGS